MQGGDRTCLREPRRCEAGITHAKDELACRTGMKCHWVEQVLPFRRADYKDAFAAAHAAGRGGGGDTTGP